MLSSQCRASIITWLSFLPLSSLHPFTGKEKKSLKNEIEIINVHRQAAYTKKQEIPVGSPLLKLFSKSFLVSTLPGFQSQVTRVLSAYFSGRLLGSLLFFCTKAAHPPKQTVLQVTSFVVIESIPLSDPKTLPPG